jgi:hypothetical protein
MPTAATRSAGRPWPGGFVGPERRRTGGDGDVQICGLPRRKQCRLESSMTAGIVFAYSKLSLAIWFLMLYLVAQNQNTSSALLRRAIRGPAQGRPPHHA